jgi:hypothetical protein
MAGLKPATLGTNRRFRMADSQKTIHKIRVQGHLDKQRSEWFGGLSITHEPDGETILSGADATSVGAAVKTYY